MGNTFTCLTKTTCNINLTGGKVRKDTIYYWDFGKDEIFYGANPLSHQFSRGQHEITLKILDVKTLNMREEHLVVIVKKLVSIKKPKKPKKPKTIPVKTEKPLVLK